MSKQFRYKAGDRLKLTREIIVDSDCTDHDAGIYATIPETGQYVFVPIPGATFEKVRKTLREQYDELPVGAKFQFVVHRSGEVAGTRIKLSDSKYYDMASDIVWGKNQGNSWIIDTDTNGHYDIKEVGK